jgi:hypothetical protein
LEGYTESALEEFFLENPCFPLKVMHQKLL